MVRKIFQTSYKTKYHLRVQTCRFKHSGGAPWRRTRFRKRRTWRRQGLSRRRDASSGLGGNLVTLGRVLRLERRVGVSSRLLALVTVRVPRVTRPPFEVLRPTGRSRADLDVVDDNGQKVAGHRDEGEEGLVAANSLEQGRVIRGRNGGLALVAVSHYKLRLMLDWYRNAPV
jgi:hypothetical protein